MEIPTSGMARVLIKQHSDFYGGAFFGSVLALLPTLLLRIPVEVTASIWILIMAHMTVWNSFYQHSQQYALRALPMD